MTDRGTPYVPRRDTRFEYAGQAVAYIERHNCARGCVNAGPDTSAGPGGTCHLLAAVSMGDGPPIPEHRDMGRRIVCTAYTPLPAPEAPAELPAQTETLFDTGEPT